MFLFFNAFNFDDDADIASKVKQASEDERAFEVLSKEFASHNKFVASRATGRFITESDDEWSVVLLAFYEAVKKYDPGRGSFTAFSDLVIKRRLADLSRTRQRTAAEIPSDFEPGRGESASDARPDPAAGAIAEAAAAEAERDTEARDIRSEIEVLNRTLSGYGISFSDLPEVSPKAEKTRQACAEAIMAVAGDANLLEDMRRRARLPAKEISKRCGIPLKSLDKHRKYIIAVIEIMTGEYASLQQYTEGVAKRVR